MTESEAVPVIGGEGVEEKLSKNELKKLAKKAEKSALKKGGGDGGSGDSSDNKKKSDAAIVVPTTSSTTTPTTVEKTATTATKPTTTDISSNTNTAVVNYQLQLWNPTISNSTTKVLWAGQLYKVPIETDSGDGTETKKTILVSSVVDPTTTSVHTDNNNNKSVKPLVSVGGGGNAMALAVASISTSASTAAPITSMNSCTPLYFQSCYIDEWCEWERTNLRPLTTTTTSSNNNTNDKQIQTVFQYLERALQPNGNDSSSASPVALVGTQTTVADICVVTTLATLLKDSTSLTMPPTVSFYYQFHLPMYEKMIQTTNDFVTLSTKKQKQQQQNDKKKSNTSKDTPASAAVPFVPKTDTELMNETCLLKTVTYVFESIIRELYGNDIILPDNIVKQCSNPKHGDYQCSAAMPVFAFLQKQQQKEQNVPKNPPEVAKAIIEKIGTNHSIVTEVTIQGPGFVLCRLQSSYLRHHTLRLLRTQQLPFPQLSSTSSSDIPLSEQVCVVDFSSPNIAKEMHVGHLRSTIIGECVCRILEQAGYGTVHRVNHVGDWGTQFGMLIQYLREEYPNVVNNDNDDKSSTSSELPNITDLTVFYKNAKERFDLSPEFKKQSQLNVVQLQAGDVECIKIWNLLCDISRREFEKVYHRLDVTVHECGESFYNNKIPDVITEFTNANLITISDEGGAKCVFNKQFPIPLMLQKSDGGYGYDSTDMAALKYRLQVLQANRIIIITDFTQSDHFKMIYQAGHDIGWVNNTKHSLEHIGFGTVQGEDGKRFKTRSGDTVRLVDLLDEAVERMEQSLRERMQKNANNNNSSNTTSTTTTTETETITTTPSAPPSTTMSDEEIRGVAEAIGYGAVKYFDLRRNPTSNYKFSYDQMLSTVGDTAVYLLYARVRLDSIVTKALVEHNINIPELLQKLKNSTTSMEGSNDDDLLVIEHSTERMLVYQLHQFADVMVVTLQDLYPYHICEYVYKLATCASDFVTQCRVLDNNNTKMMTSRLLLCAVTSLAMNQCFQLLGIRHVQRI